MRQLIAELPPVSTFEVTHQGVAYAVTWVETHDAWPRAFEARPKHAGHEGLLCGVVLFRPRSDGRYWPYGVTRGVETVMLEHLRGRELGWVPTPPAVADELATLAEIQSGHRLLDPSAGLGALTHAALRRGATVCAVEIDHDRAMHLCVTTPGDRVFRVYERDFLSLDPSEFSEPFDRVLMSPPFRLVGLPFADLAHVAHAIRFVAPGGRLVAVMHARLLDDRAPNHVRAFRARLQMHGAHIAPMTEGAFRAGGGDAPTVVVVLDAPVQGALSFAEP